MEKSKRRAWGTDTIDYLTQDEMRRLLGATKKHGTSKRDYSLFLIAYRHGLRASEVGLLRVNDLDLQQAQIRITRLKESLSGVNVMQPDEIRAVKAYLKARSVDSPTLFLSRRKEPISRRQLDRLMKHYGTIADIPKETRHFHALKHTIVTHMSDAGLDPRFVQRWVGHASMASTQVYEHLTTRRFGEEARKAQISSRVV